MSEATLPVRVKRYGVDEPLPERRNLRAGPLTAVLEDGDLRYVKVGGVEVVRRLYVAIRDRDWGTIPPRFTRYEVADDGRDFSVEFTAIHQNGDVDFSWEGSIRGSSAGTIVCTMDGTVGKAFLRNRIGFCVLHPTELAGTPVEIETPAGVVQSAFPDLISPDQPFLDMVELNHSIGDDPGARFRIRFEGDLFETEDQRNWTDASYKTYGTPLRLPYPVQVEAGQRIWQQITLTATGSETAGRRDGGTAGTAETDVSVGAEPIGALPAIGFGAARHRQPLSKRNVETLRALRPAHLRVDLDLSTELWVDVLARAGLEARALEVPGLELGVMADAEGNNGLPRLATALSQLRVPVLRVLVFPPVSEPVTFPRQDLSTTSAVFRRAQTAFADAGVDVPLGGGARSYFTEFNRASGTMPVGEMACAGYSINPQVHAFDNASLVETLATQAETVRSAKAIAGQVPLTIGPVSLRPRFNPNATGPAVEIGPDELSPAVDSRQLSLFGAGWTVGSLRHLAQAAPAAVTYFETSGWRGLVERGGELTKHALFPSQPDMLFPLYHVFAAIADIAPAELLPVTLADRLAMEALALRTGDRLRVLVASFGDEERPVTVSLPPLADGIVRFLDETTYEVAQVDPAFFRGGSGQSVDASAGEVTLTLRPFAVAFLSGRLAR